MIQLKEIIDSTKMLLPEWFLAFGILLLVIVISFQKKESRLPHYLTFLILIIYGFLATQFYENLFQINSKIEAFNGMIHIDKASVFFKQLSVVSAILFMVHTRFFKYKFEGEIYFLILIVLFGLVFLSMSTHFLIIYLAIEMVSIASYAMVSVRKFKENFEAGIKYLIVGATSSAIMLYGISYFYGIGHNLNFADPQFIKQIHTNTPLVIQIISFLVLGGIFFKIAAAPFHSWVPDVYEVTHTPIISFLSFAPKAVGFLVISRMIAANFVDLNGLLLIIIFISLIIGNLAALWQTNFKRMLGYSGIAQSGFILIGILKGTGSDYYGAYFYILAYLPITMGAFFLADLLYKQADSYEMEDFKGLGQKNIFLGLNAVFIMMALVGLPPTVGFLAKLMVFSSLINIGGQLQSTVYYLLLIFGLLNAAISIYYYLKVPYFMLIKKAYNRPKYDQDYFLTLILTYFTLAIVLFFFYPDFGTEWVREVLF